MEDDFVGNGEERSPATDDLGQATEESLIERMLDQENPPVEENQAVAEQPQPEPTTPSEEVEEAAYEDVEETIDEIDSSDSEEPEVFTVKIDGEEHAVNLDELKRGYSGQSYINSQMQKVAESRKEAEHVFAALSNERAQVHQALQMLSDGTFATPPVAPDEALFQSDPLQYMEQKLAYDQAANEYQQKLAYMQNQAQANQQVMTQAQQAYLAKEAELLQGFAPDLFDPEKGAEAKQQLVSQAANSYGFTPEELGAVVDHRHVRVLMDALAYRELNSESGKKRVEQKVQTKQVRSSKRKVNAEQHARRKQIERFKQTGEIEDAIGLLLE